MTYASSVRIARRGFSLASLVVLVAAGSGCNKLKARDLLNKGVANFKNGQYDAAVEDFKEAKDLDPSLLNARLYLATAYASQYIRELLPTRMWRAGMRRLPNSRECSRRMPIT